jgi:hypothetical protein
MVGQVGKVRRITIFKVSPGDRKRTCDSKVSNPAAINTGEMAEIGKEQNLVGG